MGRGGRPGWKALAVTMGGWLLGGCGEQVSPSVRLSTRVCSGTPVLEGVRYLRWRVTGVGLEPVERFTPVEEGVRGAPAVASGKGRVLEVRGYTDLPVSGGRVVAVGRSHASDWSATPEGSTVDVALRRVGEYTRPSLDGDACLELAEARAGHTATLLEDGRVLLAGGFQLDSEGRPSSLASVEVFHPSRGSLERLPDLSAARAFHTATRLPDGQVMLVGGEVWTAGEAVPLKVAQVLDVAAARSTSVEWAHARGRHAAAVDASGRVLVVGGVGEGGRVVTEAEGYDSTTGRVFSVATPVARVGMGAQALGDGQRIAVVGGSDGVTLQPDVLVFAYQEDSFVPVSGGGVLREPRRDAALVPFGSGERLLYVGGHASPGEALTDTLLASSEMVLSEGALNAGAAPQVFARSGPCAVALPDGRVMTLGGRGFGSGGLVSDPHAELLFPGKDGSGAGVLGMKNLERPRYEHTCTVLEDGAVLVAGGVEDDGGERATLGDLFVYTPPPLD
ncbi:hypothetical protein MEBOL_005707 [Melittangium boletus DSM 14713]|uniref:Uncharacterized protein n=2 Tax=Melittangium boletus TaxID=83453 RepID=A0A250IM23_9BACT|nr:hypothetical protein MEBOL_005707 [Melittangium boletus DSM 14713]